MASVDDFAEAAANMKAEHLACRGRTHRWIALPIPAKRRAELDALGQREEITVCEGKCGQRITRLYDRGNGEVLEEKRTYGDKAYLLPRGTGRLPKGLARVLLWNREGPRRGRQAR